MATSSPGELPGLEIHKFKLKKMIATVKYQIASYSGEVEVICDENDSDEYIISKAKRIVKQKAGGSLPFGYESWKVVYRS